MAPFHDPGLSRKYRWPNATCVKLLLLALPFFIVFGGFYILVTLWLVYSIFHVYFPIVMYPMMLTFKQICSPNLFIFTFLCSDIKLKQVSNNVDGLQRGNE